MNNSPLFSNKRIFKYSLLIGYCLYDRLRRFPSNKLPRPLTLRQTHCRFFLVDHSYDTYINQIKIKKKKKKMLYHTNEAPLFFYLSHDPWQTHTHTHILCSTLNWFSTQTRLLFDLSQHPLQKQNGRPHLDPSSFANTHTHTRTHTSFVLIHCE